MRLSPIVNQLIGARCAALATAVLFPAAIACTAHAQVLGGPFEDDYTIVDLGSIAGVPTNYGGLTFLDANTLLIGGAANQVSAAIYSVPVTRDLDGHVVGFGTPSLFATAPQIDGGLTFGPGGVLFFTTYSNNNMGQILPGSTAPDKMIALTPLGVAGSTGTMAFVPPGFAGAGQMKIASWSASQWYTASYAPDGMGTYDITAVSSPLSLPGGPEGIVYVSSLNLGFDNASVLVSMYSIGAVVAYEIDGNGDPIPGTARTFISGLTGAEGAAFDPVTGDFFFSTFGGGNRVIRVTGFIPEPATAGLLVAGSLLLLRRRL